jgi:hypothetical protein
MNSNDALSKSHGSIWHKLFDVLVLPLPLVFFIVLGTVFARVLPAEARVERLSLEFPIYAQSNSQAVWQQAESFVAQRLNQLFQQTADLDSIELLVTANRDGDILPFFSISVSREQWRSRPEVKAWMQYHQAFVQFERSYTRSNIATRPAVNQSSRQTAIDRAFDQKQFSPQEAQRYLSDLD